MRLNRSVRMSSIVAGLAVALPMAGCKKPPEQPAPESPVEAPEPPVPPPAPKPVEAPKPPPPKEKPAPARVTVPADQQMLDDADATGMTSRAPADDSGEAGQSGEATNRE